METGNSRDKGVDFGLCSGGDPSGLRAQGGERGVRGLPTLYGREGRREPLSPGAVGGEGGGPMRLHESL